MGNSEERYRQELDCRAKRLNAMRMSLYLYYTKYNWHWFCSFNLPDRKGSSEAEAYLKKWIKVQYQDRMRVGYAGQFVSTPHPHVHLLLVGYWNKIPLIDLNETLFTMIKSISEKRWASVTKHGGCIKTVHDVKGIAQYLAFENTPDDRYELVNPYGLSLLERNETTEMKEALP